MKRNIVIMLMLFCYGVQGQVRTITGVVSDATGTLPGANVVIKGTSVGVQTDIDGKYAIQAKAGDVLEFSFVGLKTKSINVKEADTISTVLSQDSVGQVPGGCHMPAGVKKKRIAAQHATISAPSVFESLSGQIQGVAAPKKERVIVRCGSPYQTEPLYVVDGRPVTYNDFRALKPEDIESVHVLKDAAATALYGNRVFGGVIVIITKDCETYDKYITGLVTDKSGVPLKNVLIQVENWPNFELTEFDGQFNIGVSKHQSLVVSNPDYKSVTIKAEQLGNRNIVLERRP